MIACGIRRRENFRYETFIRMGILFYFHKGSCFRRFQFLASFDVLHLGKSLLLDITDGLVKGPCVVWHRFISIHVSRFLLLRAPDGSSG